MCRLGASVVVVVEVLFVRDALLLVDAVAAVLFRPAADDDDAFLLADTADATSATWDSKCACNLSNSVADGWRLSRSIT